MKRHGFCGWQVVKVVISSATTILTESIKELESKTKIEENKEFKKIWKFGRNRKIVNPIDKINADIRLKILKLKTVLVK